MKAQAPAREKPGLRARLYRAIEPGARPHGLSTLNLVLGAAILASCLAAVLETEPTITAGREALFDRLETGFTVLFAVEYLARWWTSVENPRCGSGLSGRLRWMLTPAALIDLLALLPAIVLAGSAAMPAFLLRLFRLARILRLAKLGRMSRAYALMTEALASRRAELMLSLGILAFALLGASTLLYLVEGQAQPAEFGSIPRAMWWSVITMTTVGYGDVVPVTAAGRVLGGVIAVIGVGVVALPAGIIAAAFSDALQRRRQGGHRD